jgi:hypothetical protein
MSRLEGRGAIEAMDVRPGAATVVEGGGVLKTPAFIEGEVFGVGALEIDRDGGGEESLEESSAHTLALGGGINPEEDDIKVGVPGVMLF